MAFVERLCNDPDFPKNCIKSAAVHYVDFTAPFIEKICQNKAFPKHSIHEYIVMYQEGTTEMFDKIYSASHIPNEMKIKLFKTLSPGNVDMADKILFDKSFNITLENAERILQELSRTNSSAYHISSPEEILLRNQLVENLIKNKKFPQDKIADIIRATGIDSDNPITINKIKNAMYLCDNLNRIEISIEQLPMLIKNTDRITTRQIKTVNRLFRERNIKVSDEEFAIACQFADVAEKTNINEIPQESKKNLLRTLVACNEGFA